MNAFARVVATSLGGLLVTGIACAATPGNFGLPEFQQYTLANGAQVAVMPRRDTPLVAMTVRVRGGALADAPGREGTASLLAELMQKGAGPRTASQFAEAIENAGGVLSVGAGTEGLVLGANFLSRDVALMLELAGDALFRPRLDAGEFDKARTLAIQSIVAAKDADPSALIGEYGSAWLFRGHPYGRPVGGSESSLAAVTLDDVRRLYGDTVRGDRLIVAVAGDIEPDALKRDLERAFGSAARGAAPPEPVGPPSRIEGRRVLLVDKPGATQTYFWLGNVGASRTDPGRTAQTVVNTVFGGRFTSMLNSELRIKSGLTYGAGSGFERFTQPGPFSIASFTEAGTTVEAIDMALATLDRLHAGGLDAATLRSAQAYLLGQFPPTLQTNAQLAGRLADLVFYGLGRSDVDGFSARVMAVDAAAARETIENAFPASSNLAMVLIGDAAKIRAAVGKYGPVTEMKISDPRFAPQ
jgi:zinc protease